MADRPLENLLTKEWLLTNTRGGYASSTIIGCNTRKYHGLLVGSLNPPTNRIMALANCLEMVIFNGKVSNLSTFEFSDKFAPKGFKYIKQFRRDTGVHFDYQLEKLELTKSVYLLPDTDIVVLMYDFTRVQEPTEFVLRPFVGLRDFHALQKSYAPLKAYIVNRKGTPLCNPAPTLPSQSNLKVGAGQNGNPKAHLERNITGEIPVGHSLLIRHDVPHSCELFLSCSSMDPAQIRREPELNWCGVNFEKDKQWWFNFVYRNDRQRGQDFTEDLWTPGFFRCRLNAPTRIVFQATLSSCEKKTQYDIEAICEDLNRHQNNIITAAKTKDRKLRTLCLAADQFITERNPDPTVRDPAHEPRVTILAGFPWFADWGRDTFVALPGLLLSTSRFEEAKSVLTTFAQAADDGLIPNRFDDHSDTAYFNSIDASLWFINAAFQYLYATADSKTFTQQLLPTIRWIIDSFHNGTRFGIHADTDGLITAGNGQTQLTWMDAKYDGVAFTPRYGKAVEVNALWYNALCCLAQFYTSLDDMENAKHYKSMSDKVAASFCRLFWNETAGFLNDCILPDGSADATLRPNQIFAVSLEFSPLPRQQQKSVVDVVQKNLLTPFGLRTLNAQDSRYKGKYTGPQQQRDEAYHQGTVWPYLIGPFVASYLKVNDFSRKAKRKAAELIEPLMQHLTEDACLGSISEIFDGDQPYRPRGCIAQAWSIAELIRAYQLINS